MKWREKRIADRHAVELPIRYRVLGEGRRPAGSLSLAIFSERTKDISDAGLLFLSSQAFKIGAYLELKIPIGDRVFTLEGRVAHNSQDSESQLFRTGIQFSNPDGVFKVKMAEQIRQIDEYRKALSIQKGCSVSSEEAAQRWIEEHSERFAEFYK
jgi:hypothetical protein